MSLYHYTSFVALCNTNYVGCSPTHLLPDDKLETFVISGDFLDSRLNVFTATSFTDFHFNTKLRMPSGISPIRVYDIALMQGLQYCSNSDLLHFPGTCPKASHLKQSVTAAINLSDLAVTMPLCTNVKTAKTINEHIAIRIFFSAVLSCLLCFAEFDWKIDF